MKEHSDLILDGTKINWHLDRVQQWENGERPKGKTPNHINFI